jgi:type IV secretion system protein TrbI
MTGKERESEPEREPDAAAAAPGKLAPETLELRARPQPVTRINRRVLIGLAAVVLFVLSTLVLLALKPPSLRGGGGARPELFNLEQKPVPDALSKLPASYDGVRPGKTPEENKPPPGVPKLVAAASVTDEDAVDRARLLRLAGQARDSQLFFRVQTKPGETLARSHAEAVPRSAEGSSEAGPTSALRAASRAAQLAAGEAELAGEGNEAARKLALLKAAPETNIYNPHALERPASPYQLMAGTIIAASLISGLNSDLPGFVIAQVTEHVYDSASGRFLLIPQGSRLIGRYDNIVAFGQERALVIWQRLILPNGSSVVIDNLPATDTAGYAGLADDIDLHTFKLLKGVALATVLGIGSQLAFGTSDNDLVRALQLATQATSNRAGQRLVERNLNVQPTLTVRPGWPLRVIVHKDLILKPYPLPQN